MQPSWLKRTMAEIRRLEAKPQVRRALSLGVLLFTAVFMLVLVRRSAGQLSEFEDWSAFLGALAIGFLLYPLSLVIQAFVWQLTMVRVGGVRGGWWDLEIYAYTHLVRRLPGAVWYLAGRTAMYRGRGVGAGVTLAASGVEWLLLMLAAAAVYVAFTVAGDAPLVAGLTVSALLLILAALIFRRFLTAGTRIQSLPVLRHKMEPVHQERLPRVPDVVFWLALYGVCYLIGGAILLILTQGVVPDSAIDLGDATRVWALAGGTSLLFSTVIPAGLGVRELTLTVLLAPFASTTAAILVAVLLRLLFIGGDLVWGLGLWGIARFAQHRR
jgi:hypothetical protein